MAEEQEVDVEAALAKLKEEPIKPRRELVAFAHLMEIYLRENERKYGVNGWLQQTPAAHLSEIKEGAGELRDAIQKKNFLLVETACARIGVEAMAAFDTILFFRQELEKFGWVNFDVNDIKK